LYLHHKRVIGRSRRRPLDKKKTKKKTRIKYEFRFRPGSGRFSNMRFILENPTEVFTRVVTIYERRTRQSQGNIIINWEVAQSF